MLIENLEPVNEKILVFQEITSENPILSDENLMVLLSKMSGVEVTEIMIEMVRSDVHVSMLDSILTYIPFAVENLKKSHIGITPETVIRSYALSDFCFFDLNVMAFFTECYFVFQDDLIREVEDCI